jgi:CRP-like cAMP-binding protein
MGSIIHFPEEECLQVELILEGKVVIERYDFEGRNLRVAQLNKGSIIGGNLLFSRNPRYMLQVLALTETRLLVLTKENLLNLISQKTEFLQRYLEFMSDNAFLLGNKLNNFAKKTIRESLMIYLLDEKRKQQSNNIILPNSKKDIATFIGVQRTSVSRELAKMRNEGLIDYSGNEFKIYF